MKKILLYLSLVYMGVVSLILFQNKMGLPLKFTLIGIVAGCGFLALKTTVDFIKKDSSSSREKIVAKILLWFLVVSSLFGLGVQVTVRVVHLMR